MIKNTLKKIHTQRIVDGNPVCDYYTIEVWSTNGKHYIKQFEIDTVDIPELIELLQKKKTP